MDNFLKKIFPYAGMLLVVIVVGYFARKNHNYFEKSIVDQTRAQLLVTARLKARSLGQQVLNLTQELEILSGEEVVQEAFSYRYGKTKHAGFSLMEDSYRDIKSLAASLSMIDAKGEIIYEVPSKDNIGRDLSSEVDVRKGLADHHAQASGIMHTASGMPVLTFDQPVFSQDKFVGLLRSVISLETLQAVVNSHEGEDAYFFLTDQDGRLLSYPDRHYLGQYLSKLFDDNHLPLENSGFKTLMEKGARGEDGSGISQLFPLDSPHKAEEVIVAFSPVFFGGNAWSLVVGKDYDSVSGPVNRNARDNIIFAGFVIFALCFSAAAFYLDQKKKNVELQRLYENLEKNLEELRSTQSLLIQSAKMESVGKLAAGVAHEVKNPLAIILMSTTYLKNNVKSRDEQVAAFLDDIENAVKRADTIVKGLLDFSSELEIRAQDVHILIDRSFSLAKHLLVENKIQVVEDFGEDLPEVNIDRNKIEQVFVNLIMNSIQAMPFGGELRVKTFREGSGEGQHWVVVRIEDTGTGMPGSVLKDLFVPFVTTKRSEGGTGLGLSIVKNIMELHGGRIALENKAEGQGVRATLWFKI
jgi:signal transduction histidine kinase